MAYDLIVIGGGPAGYLAAERAGHAGLSTLLIEKRHVGGVCLNEGCVPSKSLLYSAKIADSANHGEKYGVIATAKLDHAAVVARKEKVVKTLVSGIKAKLKKNKVTVVEAVATIRGRTAEGFQVEAGGTVHIGTRLMLATGSVPVVPPIPGVKEGVEAGFVLTNREILSLKEVPGKLVIVGGGVIGLEMASYYASAGSQVTVIEMMDKIAGPTDAEISQTLLKTYQKKGVTFELGAKVTAVGADSVTFEKGGTATVVPADKVLLSIGRRAFTEGLGLESIGVMTERGRIPTDENGRTNVAGVYAAGDVNGVWMLAHTAYREAEVAVHHMLGKKDKMRYNANPSVIYTTPEVAGVGETEDTAKQKGLDVTVTKLPLVYSGRYVAENEGGDGFIKVLTDSHRRIVGVHMIGSYASEIIFGAAMMIETEMRVEDVREIIFPHPTVCEVLREAVWEIH